MKRLIDYHLSEWKVSTHRKPLILRGARQVGKTHAVRTLGKSFENFVEINFEFNPDIQIIFEKNLDPVRIIQELSLSTKQKITPGSTLLFLDEIQVQPRALTALRYFYEMMPNLHVIAAGSLLDFAIEQVGIPVGRVQSLYMYPVSFMEYLASQGYTLLLKSFIQNSTDRFSTAIHDKGLALLGEYLGLGGMPEAIQSWIDQEDPLSISTIHQTLLDTYRQDFNKYAKEHQIKYLELLFNTIPSQVGNKFKFSAIPGEYRKRELSPALDLLVTAGIVHRVYHSSGQGVPLGATTNPDDFKSIFLDIALGQALLGNDYAQWFINPHKEFINKGPLVEAFVGQEILAYENPIMKKNLYYWHRESRSSQAEVDYLIQKNTEVVPVEVKSGSGRTLKSLQLFLESHQASPYGIKFSTQEYSFYEKIYSYPLYAIAQAVGHEESRKALEFLC